MAKQKKSRGRRTRKWDTGSTKNEKAGQKEKDEKISPEKILNRS